MLPKLPAISLVKALIVLRGLLGLIFISHGVARLYYDSVAGFGEFLNSQGLLLGGVIAWTVTIGEIVSGSLLIYGWGVRYLAIFHALIIVSGIFLVHLPNGWFVVGHGQGGVEYSVLLLAALLVVYSSQGEVKKGEVSNTTL